MYLILDKDADPDESDQNKYTALTYAILAENVEITEKLINKTTNSILLTKPSNEITLVCMHAPCNCER